MSTYAQLIQDVRGHSGVNTRQKGDKHIARQIWRGFCLLVREAMELNHHDHRLPHATTTTSAPADLDAVIDGPSLGPPQGVLKVLTVQANYDDGSRGPVNIIPEYARWGDVDPRPAGFLTIAQTSNQGVRPVPGRAGVPWTHANIVGAGGWGNVDSITYEYINEPTEPDALSDQPDVDRLFHDAGVWYGTYAVTKNPDDYAMFEQAKVLCLGSLRIQPAGSEAVVDVRG